MDKEIKVWLSDIRRAIAEINQFLPERKMFQEFQKDLNQSGQLKEMLK